MPSDYGGQHFVQAFLPNGTGLPPKAAFIVEPSFHISPTSGPAGTPITVTATGLGYSSYSTTYHLSWDNTYVGYMTAVSTGGATTFNFYASGTVGMHYINIYEGYPGPEFLNPQQGPPSSETASIFQNYIPFYTNFTITAQQVTPQPTPQTTTAGFTTHAAATAGLFALLAALAGGALFVSRKDPEERKAFSKVVAALVIVALVAVAGAGAYVVSSSTSASASQSSTSQTSSVPQVSFTPVATADRPHINVPLNNATTGPRISITPTIASVGDTITVNGAGFAPNASLPLVWTTRVGSNMLGYKLVNKPLKTVTAGSGGSFSFSMKVPPDVGGLHYIAAGNLTMNSNGTVFVQRSATISTTEGPQGTQIQLIMQGVGWDLDDSTVAVDYDNSYLGFACGFNSGGNVTVTIVATGAPGIHTIDVYPSVASVDSTVTTQQPGAQEYRYPVLDPQDFPEPMPSFHFTFLMTAG